MNLKEQTSSQMADNLVTPLSSLPCTKSTTSWLLMTFLQEIISTVRQILIHSSTINQYLFDVKVRSQLT